MRHVHDVIDTISADESPEQLASEGIELVRGWAWLTGPTTLDVDGRTLRGSRLVLATGASAAVPPVEGLADSRRVSVASKITLQVDVEG